MAEFPSIAPAPYQQNPNSTNRIGQKELLPRAVQSRNLASDVIQLAGIYGWSFTLAANTYTTAFLQVSTANNDEMLPVVESFICQDVYDADHALKGGASVNPTNWDVYGPYLNIFAGNYLGTYVSVFVLNRDTVSHTVIMHMRIRFISAQASGPAATS